MVDLRWLAVLIFIISAALAALLIRRGRAGLGIALGALVILVPGLVIAVLGLACRSDNPVGCEWAGVGALAFAVITLALLLLYGLLVVGLLRICRPLQE